MSSLNSIPFQSNQIANQQIKKMYLTKHQSFNEFNQNNNNKNQSKNIRKINRRFSQKNIDYFDISNAINNKMNKMDQDTDINDNDNQITYDMEIDSTIYESINDHDISTDEEIKFSDCNDDNSDIENKENDNNSDDYLAEIEKEKMDDIIDGLNAISYLNSPLSSDYSVLQSRFRQSPRKWCSIINFVIQLHYDMGHPSLKPNIIHLTAEYLAYLVNKKNLFLNFDTIDVRYNIDIRMALFEAVKYDQGFQMNVSKLFNMKYYTKKLVFLNDKSEFNNRNNKNNNNNVTNIPTFSNDNDLASWLRIKEIEFCNKLDWNFTFSTRYQILMIYLRKLGFDVDNMASAEYKTVKNEYNNLLRNQCRLSDNILFCFLCRYLIEISYYKPDFYGYDKSDLIIAVIYTAYTIAQRWIEKFNFNNLLIANNLYEILDDKHPISNDTIHSLIKKLIRMSRTPHACSSYCVPIYYYDNNKSTTHYHDCKCILNCCLNTYLKYSKIAFGEISKMPCLTTTNLNKFVDWFENNNNKNNENNNKMNIISTDNSIDDNDNWKPIMRAFASNKSVL